MKNARLLLVVATALPMVAGAQTQPPAGPPANPIATVFRNRSASLRRNIAQAFDSIPESKFSFKPTDKQQTLGYVAQHVTDDSYYYCGNFSDRKPTRPESHTTTPDSIKAKWPKDSLVAQLKAAFQFCDEVAANMDDAAATAIITVPGPNNTTRQTSRVNALLGHAMDLQDHYSQIANYMRLIGMLPPTALPRPGRGGN
jgi:uncharacterized damage-inducible protein DinB